MSRRIQSYENNKTENVELNDSIEHKCKFDRATKPNECIPTSRRYISQHRKPWVYSARENNDKKDKHSPKKSDIIFLRKGFFNEEQVNPESRHRRNRRPQSKPTSTGRNSQTSMRDPVTQDNEFDPLISPVVKKGKIAQKHKSLFANKNKSHTLAPEMLETALQRKFEEKLEKLNNVQ